MRKSGLFLNEAELSYELLKDGYEIFWGEEESPRLAQREPDIPYPWLGYEENAIIQIRQICGLNPEIPEAETEEPWARIERILTEDMKETAQRADALGKSGAAAMQLAVSYKAEAGHADSTGTEVTRSIAVFTGHYPAWIADGGTEGLNHIAEYNGTAYICINPIQRLAHWTPDAATNNYCPYPSADRDGVYPYVSGMLVWGGMKVRGGDGEIYRCTLTEGTYKLVNEPKDAASIFEIDLPFS